MVLACGLGRNTWFGNCGTHLTTRKDYVFANIGRVALIFEETN